MRTHSLIAILIVGLVAGWLAGLLMKGGGLGLIGDIIVGIVGAFIGNWLFTALHIHVGINFWVDAIVTATIGAMVLLFVLRLIRA